jgi:hypothetical protein
MISKRKDIRQETFKICKKGRRKMAVFFGILNLRTVGLLPFNLGLLFGGVLKMETGVN